MTQDREGRVVRRREVGCQSTSAERRDAAVQVDLLSWRHCAGVCSGVCDVQWHCVSVRADEPGGGALLQHCRTHSLDSEERCPPLYLLCSPLRHMQLPTMHLSEPSTPPAPQQPELQQTTSLPSMPLCKSLPPLNISAAPPGLIAPLSPRLAVEEEVGGAKAEKMEETEQVGRPRRRTVGPPIRYLLESEEQSHGPSAANHSKVGGSKVKRRLEQLRGELKEEEHHEEEEHQKEEEQHHEEEEHQKEEEDLIKHENDENFTVTPEKKRRESQGGEGSAHNGIMLGEKPQKAGSRTQQEETERRRRRRGVTRGNRTTGGKKKQQKKKQQLTEEEGGRHRRSTEEQRKEEEEEGGAKPEQAGRPRRRTVGPPIRYLLESEEQSHSPSAANHSKAWRPKLKRRLEVQSGEEQEEQEEQEDRRGGGKQTEEAGGSRVEASEDGGADQRWRLCQVCGLTFAGLSSLQRHLSVHRAARRLSCHLCDKNFSRAKTLRLHQLRHHHGSPLGFHGNTTMLEAPKATDDKPDEEESSNGEREERGERSELEEQETSLQASTKASDWSRRTKRVCRHSQWWISFRTKMKRRQDAQRRRREERGGEGRRNRKMVRAEEEVKQVCLTEEEGEHRQQEGERKRDGEEEEKEKEVELPQRPRRKMVGPPIRYLLESEEPSHGKATASEDKVRAFQQNAKPQKKSEARGGASEGTGQTDRQVGETLPERQTGSTNQDAGNRPRGGGGRPDKVGPHSEAGGGASEMIDRSGTTEKQTGQESAETQTGHMSEKRQTGQMDAERHTGRVRTDRQTDHTYTETGTRYRDPERQTGSYRANYLVHIDVHSRQVTIISPCCVRLQRLPLIG